MEDLDGPVQLLIFFYLFLFLLFVFYFSFSLILFPFLLGSLHEKGKLEMETLVVFTSSCFKTSCVSPPKAAACPSSFHLLCALWHRVYTYILLDCESSSRESRAS